jgi:hypothetical protein
MRIWQNDADPIRSAGSGSTPLLVAAVHQKSFKQKLKAMFEE